MNRHYDTAEYRRIVGRLRASFDNASITTDIMVGFPGETEEEFRLSCDFAEEIGFAKVHVFPYSRRPGTVADRMEGQLTNAVKEKRSAKMIALTQKTKDAFFRSQIGREESVLFERLCAKNVWEGYTKNYTPVRVVSAVSLAGQERLVRLTEGSGDFCFGILLP